MTGVLPVVMPLSSTLSASPHPNASLARRNHSPTVHISVAIRSKKRATGRRKGKVSINGRAQRTCMKNSDGNLMIPARISHNREHLRVVGLFWFSATRIDACPAALQTDIAKPLIHPSAITPRTAHTNVAPTAPEDGGVQAHSHIQRSTGTVGTEVKSAGTSRCATRAKASAEAQQNIDANVAPCPAAACLAACASERVLDKLSFAAFPVSITSSSETLCSISQRCSVASLLDPFPKHFNGSKA